MATLYFVWILQNEGHLAGETEHPQVVSTFIVEYWKYTLSLQREPKQKVMEINFDKEYLRQLYEDGKTTDKKHRFQPHIISRYQLRIKVLENALGEEDVHCIMRC